MAPPRSRIEVDTRSFRRYRDQSEAAIGRAVTITAQAGIGIVRSQDSSSGYDIDEVIGSVEASRALPTRRGWAALLYIKHPLGVIFEKGSYRKLGARSSNRGRASVETGNRGVKPQRMLRNSIPALKLLLMANIRRQLP
jgi:hypothetical protein